MNREQAGLEAIKARMSPQQQREMSDLIAAELENRRRQKASERSNVRGSTLGGSALGPSQVGSIYQTVDSNVRQKKVAELEKKLTKLRKQKAKQESSSTFSLPSLPRLSPSVASWKNVLLMAVIVFLAALKVIFSTDVVNASLESNAVAPVTGTSLPPAQTVAPTVKKKSSAPTELLTELDARRVELEKRSVALDDRERQLALREKELLARSVELRTMTRKLTDFRKEKDHRYEARMEQLAHVYSSMAPQEAAPLIGKLDDAIALALLQRMPGKRMGQILGLMDASRAVELTRQLTERGVLR